MEFRKYDKVHRLGKEETDGILNGTIHVEEKVDGANLSVWISEDGIHVGSRNNDLTQNGNEFNGAVSYCTAHEGIQNCLKENPNYRLYGEWLVKHTINYRATAYRKFYLFDIYVEGKYLNPTEVHAVAEKYGIEQVPYLGCFENPTQEFLKELMGKSKFGDRGEGIVLKNFGFVNQFGEHAYAKMVCQEFLEDNSVSFGGNNKFSDTYTEQYIVNKYVTLARVQKVMNKLQPSFERRLDMAQIPVICNAVYHDVVTEEAWDIAQKFQVVKYGELKRILYKKAKQVYIDILNDSISIADSHKENGN